MKIPNLEADKDGITFLVQTALAQLGYYQGEIDNIEGPITRAALDKYRTDINREGGRSGMASSFADPADVAAFRRCKAQGKSDQQCFKVGDNGRGAWNDDTTKTDIPYVAIPRDLIAERWGTENAGRGKKVKVICNGVTFTGIVGDKMPLTSNVKNGAIIDLAPGAQRIVGVKAPFKLPATWWWLDDVT